MTSGLTANLSNLRETVVTTPFKGLLMVVSFVFGCLIVRGAIYFCLIGLLVLSGAPILVCANA